MEIVEIEKLASKLMMIIYYATRTNDIVDKNINVIIDSWFDLLLPMIISKPDVLVPTMYSFKNFENFIVSWLKFKGDESVRKTVSNVFKTIWNNFHLNSQYNKEQFQAYYIASPIKKTDSQAEDLDMSNVPETSLHKPSVPYEDPKIYFLKVLLKNLPTGGKKSDKWEELFSLLNILIKSAPSLFKYIDPYQPQNENEEIDVPNIFSTNSILAQWISEIENRPIIEERQSDNEDKVLAGYLYLANSILQIEPRLKRYVGDINNGNDFVRKLYSYVFKMPSMDDKQANLPVCKSKVTRKRAFNLLLTLWQNDETSFGSKGNINFNFLTLFKELYQGHYEMKEIENKVSYDVLQNIDLDHGVRNSSGFAGLKNFGATCYMNSTIQQLYMIPDFRYGILASDVNIEDKQNSTLFQLQLIFANLQETEKRYYAPKGFTKAFKFGGESVDVRRQQDATEFISVLSDTLEIELRGTRNEKLLSEILGGEICNEIKSLENEYEYISQTPEPFFSIQLDIKNKKSIQEALDSYIKPDILEGDNKYYCEKYDKKIKVHKRAFLNKWSNVLIINLKRFEFDYTTFRRYKVNDYCEFPMNLNIKPWTSEGIMEREKAASKEESKKSSDDGMEDELPNEENKKEEVDEEDEKDQKDSPNQQADDSEFEYQAVGVVVHSGSAEGGHYYSYIKDRNKGKWYEFNDTRVTPFDTKDLEEETFGGEGKGDNFFSGTDGFGGGNYSRWRNAYFIIYEKKYPKPLQTSQLVNPDHEYVNGIPNNVYQHIWNENMLFMKTMYFYDPDYLNFLKDYLFMNNFERKLYMSESSLTKEQLIKKEVAQKFGVTTITGTQFQMNVESMDIFDENQAEMDVDEENKEFDKEADFNPEADLKNEGPQESAMNNDPNSDISNIFDTSHIDPEVVIKSKEMLSDIILHDNLEMLPNEIESLLQENPGLWVIKFATLLVLRVRHMMKDSSLYMSMLQHLNSLFEINTDGCIWFLKLLTNNPEHIIDRLFEWKIEEEREHFRALIITAISLVAKNEEKEFFNETDDNLMIETIIEYEKERDVFYLNKVPKSALIRFMQIFFEKILNIARKYWRTYEEYFQVLSYFSRLGYLETKYLVKVKGIYMLLDFIMNNSPPFFHGKEVCKMGNAINDPNFMTPIDLLSHLIRSCLTNGNKRTESYSSVSLIQNPQQHIELPEDEIKFLMTRFCFTVDLIDKQYNDSVLAMVIHLCWGDYGNSLFFITELEFSSCVNRTSYSEYSKRLSILREIIRIKDDLQEQRFELVCGLEQSELEQDGERPSVPNKDIRPLLNYVQNHRNEYPSYSIHAIKIISDMCENPKFLLYLTRNKEKIIWMRDYLDSIKLREDPDLIDKLKSQVPMFEFEPYLSMVDSSIGSLTQVFPEGIDGFRALKQEQFEEEGFEGPQQVNIQDDDIFEPPSEGTGGSANVQKQDPRKQQFEGADDDFMNVSSAPPGKEEDAQMTDQDQEFKPRLTDEESAELNNSFSK